MLPPVFIRLTAPQAAAVSWALDGMDDMCCDQKSREDEEAPDYGESDIPCLQKLVLQINDTVMRDNAIQDLLYRLEEQAQEMQHYSEPGSKGFAASARHAALLIRAATGYAKTTWEHLKETA